MSYCCHHMHDLFVHANVDYYTLFFVALVLPPAPHPAIPPMDCPAGYKRINISHCQGKSLFHYSLLRRLLFDCFHTCWEHVFHESLWVLHTDSSVPYSVYISSTLFSTLFLAHPYHWSNFPSHLWWLSRGPGRNKTETKVLGPEMSTTQSRGKLRS